MARIREAVAEQTIEQGAITFLYRPRVEEQHPDELRDVQRLLLLLSPRDSAFERLIVIGRKHLPGRAKVPAAGLPVPAVPRLRTSSLDAGTRQQAAGTNRADGDRFWGFVDLVLTPYDMQAALGAQVYGTKTRGLRHLPAARAFAQGTYEIATHGPHAHLRWSIDFIQDDDPIAAELYMEREADSIVTIANPDPTVWGLSEAPDLQADLFDELELHVTLPTPFPPTLQQRFGNRRFTQLDDTAWLDHPGAELVFLGV
jgi:hypothetical protein